MDEYIETGYFVASLVIQAAIFVTIFRKAGFSGWLGLLMVMPLLNLGLLLWFATTTWPLEMGYVGQTGNAKVNANWELKMSLRKAATLEKRGHYAEAIQQFEHVVERTAAGHPNAELARERIRQLQAKVQGGREDTSAAS
jgi:hypothetical protein